MKRQYQQNRTKVLSLARSTKLMLQTERPVPQLDVKLFRRRPRQSYALIAKATCWHRFSIDYTVYSQTHPTLTFSLAPCWHWINLCQLKGFDSSWKYQQTLSLNGTTHRNSSTHDWQRGEFSLSRPIVLFTTNITSIVFSSFCIIGTLRFNHRLQKRCLYKWKKPRLPSFTSRAISSLLFAKSSTWAWEMRWLRWVQSSGINS